jgi:hypothetical protein
VWNIKKESEKRHRDNRKKKSDGNVIGKDRNTKEK